MRTVFIIPGYGVPKDITNDMQYNMYLRFVFNYIFDTVRKNDLKKPVVICSGGKTDTYKPYKRSEGGEMAKIVRSYTKKPYLKEQTNDWEIVIESDALATLDNLLFSLRVLKRKKITQAHVYIFCEATRVKKIKVLSQKVFGSAYKRTVIPVDFDISPNRYLDQSFIDEKEKADIKYSLWALKNDKNYTEFRALFKDRIEYLRKQGKNNDPKTVKKWWEKKLRELDIT